MSEKLIVGVYHTLREAEDAVSELDRHGFPVAHVSIVAKDFEDAEKISSKMNQVAQKTDSLKYWFGNVSRGFYRARILRITKSIFTRKNICSSRAELKTKSRGCGQSSAKPATLTPEFTTNTKKIYKK